MKPPFLPTECIPLEIFISLVIKLSAKILLETLVLMVILFEAVLNLMPMFTHSNIYLNSAFERLLRWFNVAMDIHRRHHSARENETSSILPFTSPCGIEYLLPAWLHRKPEQTAW